MKAQMWLDELREGEKTVRQVKGVASYKNVKYDNEG